MNPFAQAKIIGNRHYQDLAGTANFYIEPSGGIWVEVEVTGLPDLFENGQGIFFGLHIHESGDCTLPFDRTGEHYNPAKMPHPDHAGDLPPLLGSNGYAYSMVYTGRLSPDDILNRSLVIHSAPDDFTTQPSGNSGEKIGCGVIEALDADSDSQIMPLS